jgi:putative glutamine amidotransferase
MLRFAIPMSTANANRPRVGIPWRTSQEEAQGNRDKLGYYFDRVREAGGNPEDISLLLSPEELRTKLQELDAFVLPGSPADVDPSRYGATRHAKTRSLDPRRDQTDLAVLQHAMQEEKPLLAICYGCQILNVFFKGTLIQDVSSQFSSALAHGRTDSYPGAASADLEHFVHIESGSRLAKLAGCQDIKINSSHHQAIDHPGQGLRITARATDGVPEALELCSVRNWIVGVQWHPERMPDDPLTKRLFEEFVSAARSHSAIAQRA